MKTSLSITLAVSYFVCLLFLLASPAGGPALANDQETAGLCFKTGIKALQEGDMEKAKVEFQKTLEHFPTHTDAVVHLGRILAIQKDSTGLINLCRDWLKALKKVKASPEQLQLSEELTSDLVILNKLNRLDRLYSGKFVSLAKSLKRKNKPLAIKVCETALKISPDHASALKEYRKLTGIERSTKVRPKRKYGTLLFDGETLSGWLGKQVRVSGGCLIIDSDGDMAHVVCNKLSTEESFTLRFSFQPDLTGTRTDTVALDIQLWGEDDLKYPKRNHGVGADRIYLKLYSWKTGQGVSLSRLQPLPWTWHRIPLEGGQEGAYLTKGSPFKHGKWYEICLKYTHKKSLSGSQIAITVNGKKAVTIPVPEGVSPGRSGYVGFGQWQHKSIRLKDIYLKP